MNQRCDGKYLTIGSPEIKTLISMFVDFREVYTPPVANFKLPTWGQRSLNEKRCTHGCFQAKPIWTAPAHSGGDNYIAVVLKKQKCLYFGGAY